MIAKTVCIIQYGHSGSSGDGYMYLSVFMFLKCYRLTFPLFRNS